MAESTASKLAKRIHTDGAPYHKGTSAPAGSGRSFSVTVFPPPPQAARNSEKDNARTEPKWLAWKKDWNQPK